MDVKETLLLTAFARSDTINADLPNLVRRYGSVSAVFARDPMHLRRTGAAKTTIAAIVSARQADLVAEQRILTTTGVRAIPWDHPDYPMRLTEIPDGPAIIFVRGDLAPLAAPSIAIVGTRRISRFGMDATRDIATSLAQHEVTVVSGLAFGADAIAHATTIDRGGSTIAVLASGVDVLTVGPRANAGIAERMVASGGALLSEYPPGMPGAKHRFPRRNRIVAALSSATVVTEAPERSGALITAKAALEYGRDVFSVPGPMTDIRCAGTNGLIASGAIPVCAPDTIAEYYSLTPKMRMQEALTGPAHAIVHAISDGATTIDVIASVTQCTVPETLAIVGALELSGTICSTAGTYRVIDSHHESRLP